MNHQHGSDVLHDNFNSMAFPGAAYVPSHHYQRFQQQQTPSAYRFNPQTPGFQPTGTELARYGPTAELTPPHSNMSTPSHITDLQKHVVNTHVQHTQDIVKVERAVRRNEEGVEEMRAAVGRDLRTLHGKVEKLKMQVESRGGQEQQQLAVTKPGATIFDLQVAPPEVMLQRFDKETVAMAYREQAESFQEVVERLKRDAEALSPTDSSVRMLEAAKAEQKDDDTPFIVTSSTNMETPTHVPARRAQREKSQAVKITNPAEAEATETQVKDEPSGISNAAKEAPIAVANTVTPPSDTAPEKDNSYWQPLAVRTMIAKPLPNTTNHVETFTWELLALNFGGFQWSPGFYFVPGQSIIPSKSYWILDAEFEPFLPGAPGKHGAKLTAFYNETPSDPGEAPDVENYMSVPVFVRAEGGNEYKYFGNYSQNRFSDKLDYDAIMTRVTEDVRQYWAKQLTDKGRPEWVTKCLMQHFWPRPTYDGPIPTDEALATPATAETAATNISTAMERRVTKGLKAYAAELAVWEKETRVQANYLTDKVIMEAFTKADAEELPGLRLWWEYLEFVNYDQDFYDMLCKFKTFKDPTPGMANTQARTTQSKPAVARTAPAPAAASVKTDMVMQNHSSEKVATAANGYQTVMPSPVLSKPTTAVKTTKPHTSGTKPWEKTEKVAVEQPKADLEAAKAFAAKATKAGLGCGRGSNGGANGGRKDGGGPPHLRK